MYRIKNQNSILGGVCQGLASYLKTDLTLVRIVFVVLFFTPFPIVISYLIMWAVLPKHQFEMVTNSEVYDSSTILKPIADMSNQSRNGNMVGGLILIILGAVFSFKTFFDINLFSYLKNMWPLILIGLGVWIIVKDKDDNNGDVNNTNPTGTGY
ncbi:MAG: PspC domain-containing protein [Leadbetterella sp.]|jgi:phage shock protein PspC (stress-responsive transcriptional regulator)|nr:PspC domain-containing protein [Leadbetterella sp.]